MHRQTEEKNVPYKLVLSDKRVWGFTASKKILPWLERFADIMQLESNISDKIEIDHKLTFLLLKKATHPVQLEDKPLWTMYKNGKVYRIWSHSSVPEIFVELNQDFIDHEELQYVNMWSSLKPIFRYYLKNRGGPAHAASAELDGKGILIIGSGGVGKSTAIQRLPKYWNPLSDDTTLIVNVNDKYNIHPMPTWSDHLWATKYTTFKTSYAAPLSAIFVLEQDSCDKVIPLGKNSAVQALCDTQQQSWESYCSRIGSKEKKQMNLSVFNNSCSIANKVPCYTLKATLHGKFWEEIEKVL